VTSSEASITVVIPTHDRPVLAARAVRLALAQRDVEPRVVVVDNGSTPANAARVASLASDDVEVIVEPRALGPNGARNVGVRAARTPWIAFLDVDDVWAPDKLRRQLDLLAANPHAQWCGSAAVFIDQRGAIVHCQPAPSNDDLLRTLLAANRISGGGSVVVVRRDLLLDAGGFDETLAFGEEWECWIRLALRAPAVFVPHPLVGYFLHNDGGSVVEQWRHPDLVTIEERYAAQRAELGVDFDWNSHIFATASRLMFARRRVAAARMFATVVRRAPSLEGVAGLVGSMIAPGLTSRAAKWRARRTIPREALEAVQRWLPGAIAT
jgi:glycosyltransferase involved in cell wall biosynthesis